MIKILHLPENIASFISETVTLENKFSELRSRGVVYSDHLYDSVDYSNVEIRKKTNYEIKFKPKWYLFEVIKYYKFIKDIFWADVIHWYWSDKIFTNGWEFRIIKFLRKPIVIEWLGSEIRIHEKEQEKNPYYKIESIKNPEIIQLFCNKDSALLQEKFSKLNATPLLVRGASITYHLIPSLFKKNYTTRHRINLSKYKSILIDKNNSKPLIVHAPTDKDIKGTSFILKAIKELANEGLNFEFLLLENMTRNEVKSKIELCDIFLDQLICGGYGMAATESLALGKPVVCYLHETSIAELPKNCPIVNANPDSIKDVLRKLISDADFRYNAALNSRKFVEEYYDPKMIFEELYNVYKEVLK